MTSIRVAKPYRIIFNSDGNPFLNPGASVERCIQDTFAPLENTQVDALFWCDGGGGNTARYDSRVLERGGKRFNNADPLIEKMIADGEDPPRLIVREAKRRGLDIFFSLRMNDVHDCHPRCYYSEFPLFKEQNPEWLLKAGTPYGRYTSLNFAVPEVRKLKLKIVREIFDKYDFDGIELDFMRSPPYFTPGQEMESGHLLSAFIRDVRRLIEETSEESSPAKYLAVSVNENAEANHLDGFEVENWVREGLIDILIIGKGSVDVDVGYYRDLVADTHIRVYPCLYGYPGDYNPRLSEPMAAGLATNFWRQGAHGIYLFNWFPYKSEWSDVVTALRKIGEPQLLGNGVRIFPAENARAPGAVPAPGCPHGYASSRLPALLESDQPIEVPVYVGIEQHDAESGHGGPTMELHVTCTDLIEDTTMEATINGQPLSQSVRTEHQGTYLDSNADRSVWERYSWGTSIIVRWVYSLTSDQVVCGPNTVTLRITPSGLPSDRKAMVRRVEIHAHAPDRKFAN